MQGKGYWNQMNIPDGNSWQQEPYISDRQPEDIVLPEGYTYETAAYELKDSTMEQLVDFYRDNNLMSSGNVTILSVANINRLMSSGGYNVIIRKGTTIVGSIFSIGVDLEYRYKLLPSIEDLPVNEDVKLKSSYTTHLCVKLEYRDKGLAMALIRKIMNFGYPQGIRHGYYFTPRPHHRCSLKIQAWYRPINITKARSQGFYIPQSNKQHLLYRNKTGNNWTSKSVVAGNYQSWELLKEWDNYTICLRPDKNFWDTLVSNYQTFVISKNQQPVAVVVMNLFPVIIRSTSSTAVVAEIAYLSVQPQLGNDLANVIAEIGAISEKMGATILYGYGVGPLADTSKLKIIPVSSNDYLEFYNSSYLTTAENTNLLFV